MRIRSELPSDTVSIEEVIVAAFKQAAHTDHTEQFIVRELRNAGALFASLVAEDGGSVIGHVAVSPTTISNGAVRWYGLGPISVVPERQGAGIGTQLMHAALNELRSSDACGCVVLGDPGYYFRFGFVPDPGLVLPGVPPEYFQAMSFNGALPTGTVSYHDAFSTRA